MKSSQIFGLGSYILPKNKIFLEEAFLYHDTEDSMATLLATFAGYGCTEHITVDVFIPYITKFQINNQSTSGLWKISPRLNLDLYNYKTEDTEFHIVGFDILRLPTAKTDPNDRNNHLVSDGCYENYMGCTFTYDTPHYGVYFANSYGFTNTWEGFKHGDQWGTVLINSYKPTKTLMFQLEISGYIQADDTLYGQRITDSKEILFFMGPTMRMGSDRLQIVGGIVFPIWRSQNHKEKMYATLGIVAYF